jgi:hypothetical protein
MKILCPVTVNGRPQRDVGIAMWAHIARADSLSCVQDGDCIRVAALCGGTEIPLAEVGYGLWRRKGDLGELLASKAAMNPDVYRARCRQFAGKAITWIE